MMYQAGLVLEGGAMKGVYTAGVLDFWMQESTLPNATAFRRERAACAVIFPDKKADSTAFLPTILRIKTIGDFRAC